MKTFTVAILALLFAYPMAISAAVLDDSHEHEHEHDHDHEHDTELVAYRLPDGHSLQFSDPALAQQHLEVVQKLECEASLKTEANVTTVTYQCAEWKSVEIATHELAEQWLDWLKRAGFDCSHGDIDPALQEGPEIVEFRRTEWNTVHAESADAPMLLQTLTQIGCEIEQTDDGDHLDVAFRSPLWRDLHFADHATAEQWIAWLESNGFEVHHEEHEE